MLFKCETACCSFAQTKPYLSSWVGEDRERGLTCAKPYLPSCVREGRERGLPKRLDTSRVLTATRNISIRKGSSRKGFWIVRLSSSRNTTRPSCYKVDYEHPQREPCSFIWERLRTFPAQDLVGKVVLVRCDLAVSFKDEEIADEEPIMAAASTIYYLHRIGACIVLASHWHPFQSSSGTTDIQLIADCLSKHLKKKVTVASAVTGDDVGKQIEDLGNGDVLLLGNLGLRKEEAANDKEFSRKLTEKVDILVNDAFSVTHRVLASTVGAACFTSARLAGFELERELFFLTMAMNRPKHPFVAIVGGSKFSQVISVLYNLINKCSTIIITGSMVYTFFSALGCHCISDFIEEALVLPALNFMKAAQRKKVHIVLPNDFMCARAGCIHAVFRVETIPEGWTPICLGKKSWENIDTALQTSKMALWIGPVSIRNPGVAGQASKLLARTFGQIGERGCVTIVGGKEACTAVRAVGVTGSISHMSRGGAAFLEFLRGVNLPAVAALDFASPKAPDWKKVYKNPHLPLFVDIGSGNGIFNLQMAKKFDGTINFLGLEIRKKLVDHCMASVAELHLPNVHFIMADATTAFRNIVADFPGQVVVVAIQCPDPNFSDINCRRRMVQRPFVEAVVNVLPKDGKIFLQSDVKTVAKQLMSEFLQYGGSCLTLSMEHQNPMKCDAEGWLIDNPYGVLTDWESHVLQRGDRMYRVLLSRL